MLEGLTPEEINRNRDLYRMVNHFGTVNGWVSADFQQKHFRRLVEIAPFSGYELRGSSVMDVGCANGDFSKFVRDLGAAQYYGFDINDDSLSIARQKYPGEQFELRDVLANPLDAQVDFTFANGSLYHTVSEHDNNAFLKQMVESLWDSTRYGMAFNFVPFVKDKHEPNFYLHPYDEMYVADICRNLPGLKKMKMVHYADRFSAKEWDYFVDVFAVRG